MSPALPNPFRRSASSGENGRGPDFICMGLMKAGTQWLYDQLDHHPDFWMPPYKELHYFDRKFPGDRLHSNAHTALTAPEKAAAIRAVRNVRTLSERDVEFFEQIANFDDSTRNFGRYPRLFLPAGDLLTGDITPGYSGLKDGVVKKISRRLGDVKVIMMLRDPVSRLWSQWNMHLQRNQSEDIGLDIRAFRRFADKNNVRKRSYPSAIASRWERFFGPRFKYFFLDDVIERPEETRSAVLEFLGARQTGPLFVEPGFNRKQKVRRGAGEMCSNVRRRSYKMA
jgi:hypothetical protein